jgi:hypothetical protein
MTKTDHTSLANIGARDALLALVRAAIHQDCVRLHIQADGKVIEESKSGFDPVLYPEAHSIYDNSRVLAVCDLTFDDLVSVITSGAGSHADRAPTSYITWESTLGALGDKTDMSGQPVNWFYRPATKSAPAALIAGIASVVLQAMSAHDDAVRQAA